LHPTPTGVQKLHGPSEKRIANSIVKGLKAFFFWHDSLL
jgi:hypothetical protein